MLTGKPLVRNMKLTIATAEPPFVDTGCSTSPIKQIWMMGEDTIHFHLTVCRCTLNRCQLEEISNKKKKVWRLTGVLVFLMGVLDSRGYPRRVLLY